MRVRYVVEVPDYKRLEGLHCVICGDESGNTDLCVPCAAKALERDRRAGYGQSKGSPE